MSDSSVRHNAAASVFEATTASGTAKLQYTERGNALDLTHTIVPTADEGRGVGTRLVESAIAYAEAQGKKIIPTCPFVQHYIEEHPEYGELVAQK